MGFIGPRFGVWGRGFKVEGVRLGFVRLPRLSVKGYPLKSTPIRRAKAWCGRLSSTGCQEWLCPRMVPGSLRLLAIAVVAFARNVIQF